MLLFSKYLYLARFPKIGVLDNLPTIKPFRAVGCFSRKLNFSNLSPNYDYIWLYPFICSVYTQNINHHFVSLTLGPRMNWLALAVLAWAEPNFLIGVQFRTGQSERLSHGTLEKAGLPHTAGLDCSLWRLGCGRQKIHLDIDAGKHNAAYKRWR